MSLVITRHGILDTIQDTGRPGFAKWGINPGGSMDRYASRIANALVGNPAGAALLELHFPACSISFTEHVLISLTGADFEPVSGNVRIPLWKPVLVPAGSMISFPKKTWGERCYMAVRGEIGSEKWLGSYSTNLKVAAGGNHGKRLRNGDELFITGNPFAAVAMDQIRVLPWSVNSADVYDPGALFFIPGQEWEWLSEPSQQQIDGLTEFVIDKSSDRMGYALRHEPLIFKVRQEMISSGVTFGTIQALPDGRLMILMADHQTTGGYPRIGNIISAHLPKLAQRGANEKIVLKKISHERAEKMLISLEHEIRVIRESCLKKLEGYHAKH